MAGRGGLEGLVADRDEFEAEADEARCFIRNLLLILRLRLTRLSLKLRLRLRHCGMKLMRPMLRLRLMRLHQIFSCWQSRQIQTLQL